MLLQIHREKLLQLFFHHAKHQKERYGCGIFDKLSERYGSKVTHVGLLDTKKITVLIYIFLVAIPASPFVNTKHMGDFTQGGE